MGGGFRQFSYHTRRYSAPTKNTKNQTFLTPNFSNNSTTTYLSSLCTWFTLRWTFGLVCCDPELEGDARSDLYVSTATFPAPSALSIFLRNYSEKRFNSSCTPDNPKYNRINCTIPQNKNNDYPVGLYAFNIYRTALFYPSADESMNDIGITIKNNNAAIHVICVVNIQLSQR